MPYRRKYLKTGVNLNKDSNNQADLWVEAI